MKIPNLLQKTFFNKIFASFFFCEFFKILVISNKRKIAGKEHNANDSRFIAVIRISEKVGNKKKIKNIIET